MISKSIIWLLLVVCVTFSHSDDLTTFKRFIDDGLLPKMADYLKEHEGYSLAQCGIDIKHWATSLKDSLWAYSMADAAGKAPSGLLYGNLQGLGHFDQCMSITPEKTGQKFGGKYCPINFNLTHIIKNGLMILTNNTVVGDLVPSGLTFPYGICMPDSCSVDEIKGLIKIILANANLTVTSPGTWSDRMCSTRNGPDYSTADIVAIVIYCLFGIIIIFSTIYDLLIKFKYKADTRNRSYIALSSFSLYTNTQKLLKPNKSGDNLRCLNGIRALSMLWVLLGHRYNISYASIMDNTLDTLAWIESTWSYFVIGGSVAVDSFFTLSGLLLAYVFFSQQQKLKRPRFHLGLFYFHRFMRLWPAMAALVLLQSTLYIYLSSGPTWPRGSFNRFYCSTTWWSTLLYVQNYVHPSNMCGNHLWYLAADTQLYILSPILLYPLLKNTKWGIVNMIFWILAAQATCITITYLHNWPGLMGLEDDYWKSFYFPTHMRANIWLIGFGMGYLLFRIKNKKIELNKYFAFICWLIALAIFLACVLGMKPLMQLDHKINQAQDSTFNAFGRTGWSLALCWLIFACVTGHGGPINWFLSLRIMEMVGRLSYSMYLLHVTMQIIISGSARGPRHFATFELVYLYFGDVVLILIVAYLWVMAFESPFLNMERAMLYKVPEPKKVEESGDGETAKEKV